MTKQFLTLSEFSEILRISKSSIFRGLRSGKFPYNRSIKIGRRILFPVEVVAEIKYSTGAKDTKSDGAR